MGAGAATLSSCEQEVASEQSVSNTATPDNPNILFILTDQHFADAMSCLGDTDVHTPNMDQLFREGVLIKNAYSPNPICCPCRSALITGQHPHVTGIT